MQIFITKSEILYKKTMKNTLPKLTHISKINGWIWLLPLEWQNAYELAHDFYIERLYILTRERKQEIYRSAKPEDFGITQQEANKMRKRFIRSQLDRLTQALEENRKNYIATARRVGEESFEASVLVGEAQDILKSITKYEAELRFRFKDGAITTEMIARARNYPLDRLIKITNGMARCISHEDTNPSMNCRKNYVYCHACGYHGDSIDVYMNIHNATFPESVKFLANL